MMNPQKLEETIRKTKLTKTEQVISEYILHNFNTIGFQSITEISENLNVSKASVFRTANSLGYNGFNDLKNVIKRAISSELSSDSEREYSRLSPIERFKANYSLLSAGEVLIDVRQNAIASIEDVLQKNSRQVFEVCLDILMNSRKIFVCGFRSTAGVATFFANQLLFLLPNIGYSTDADAKTIEKMVDITSEDTVVLFAYPRYSGANYIVKDIAQDAGAKFILVTDKVTSDLANGVDTVLSCNPRSLSYYNSTIPMIFICEILISELTKRLPTNFERISNWVEEYLDPTQLY